MGKSFDFLLFLERCTTKFAKKYTVQNYLTIQRWKWESDLEGASEQAYYMTLEGIQFVKEQDIESDFVEFLALHP